MLLKNFKHTIQLFGFAILFITLQSCGAAKISQTELDNIKAMKAPEDKALVYVIRPTSFGAAITMRVTCNEKEIGTTGAKRFLYTTLQPGTHRLVSHSENDDELVLIAEAGKTYYIHQKIKMGLVMARSELEVVSPGEGMKLLKKTKLAAKCPGCQAK